MRCTRGAIFDVVVDLRPESPTLPPLDGPRAHGRGGRDALRARGLRARLPDARRRHRGDLLHLGLLRARVAPAACASTTRPSASSGRRPCAWSRTRIGQWPDHRARGEDRMIIVDTALQKRLAQGNPVARRHGRRRLHGARHRAPDPVGDARAAARGDREPRRSKAERAYREAGVDELRSVSSPAELESAIAAGAYAVTRRPDGALPRGRHRGDHRDDRRRRVRRAGRARRGEPRQARHPDERRDRRRRRPDAEGLRRPQRRRLHLHGRRRARRRDEPLPLRREHRLQAGADGPDQGLPRPLPQPRHAARLRREAQADSRPWWRPSPTARSSRSSARSSATRRASGPACAACTATAATTSRTC